MTEAQAIQLLADMQTLFADIKEIGHLFAMIGLALSWALGFSAGQQR